MNSKGPSNDRMATRHRSIHDAGVSTAELVDQLITAAIGASMAGDDVLLTRCCDGLEALALTQPTIPLSCCELA